MCEMYSSGNLPVFDKRVIKDHNTEGFDSVDSEDFEIGFGCVVDTSYPVPGPPEIKRQSISKEEQLRRDYFYMTEDEKQRREDEFLAEHGIY